MRVRRTHSSIDNLPATLQKALELMLVDNTWPVDFPSGKKSGKPKYSDLEKYCMHKGYPVSKSAIGRFGVRMRILATMKESGKLISSVMGGLDSENAGQTQKAVAELITANAIELVADGKKRTSKQLSELARMARDCADVSRKADQYRQQQLKEKTTKIADATGKKLQAAGINRAKVQEIVDDILGITKS